MTAVTGTSQQGNGHQALAAPQGEFPTAIEAILSESGTQHGLTPEHRYELLKTQIAPGCTDEELVHFLYVCKSRGLDPFAKQAYAIRRSTYDKAARVKVWKMTIQTAIDGFRLIAKRGGLEAQDDPAFEYDAEERSDLNPLGLVKCTVRVWKKGSERPTTSSAYWDEYRQTTAEWQDGKPSGDYKLSGKWADMPRMMLAKVAEALTLRRAFPEELGGIYTNDEMEQAENEKREQPAPARVALPVVALPVTASAAAPFDLDSLLMDIAACQSHEALTSVAARIRGLKGDARVTEAQQKLVGARYREAKTRLAPPAEPKAAKAKQPEAPPGPDLPEGEIVDNHRDGFE